MAEHNQLGTYGEDVAAKYLENKGLTILDRNWHSGHKEIDLIAQDSGTLVIAEVKTRSSLAYGDPQDAIDSRKIIRIVKATDAYLRMKRLDLPVRFDIITIVKTGSRLHIEHIEDAFTAPLLKAW